MIGMLREMRGKMQTLVTFRIALSPASPKSCRLYAHLSNRIVPDKKVVIYLPKSIIIPAGQHGDLCLHPRLTRQLNRMGNTLHLLPIRLGMQNKGDSDEIRWRSSFCFHGPTCGASKDDQGPRLRPLACLYVSAPKHLLLLHLFPYRIF